MWYSLLYSGLCVLWFLILVRPLASPPALHLVNESRKYCTPLDCAAVDVNIMKFLTNKHCDPMSKNSDQNTPLHVPAQNKYVNIVRFLTLEMHCDHTLKVELLTDNDTALYLPTANRHLYHSPWNSSSLITTVTQVHGRTPLHYAAEFGHLHIVKCLPYKQVCMQSIMFGW